MAFLTSPIITKNSRAWSPNRPHCAAGARGSAGGVRRRRREVGGGGIGAAPVRQGAAETRVRIGAAADTALLVAAASDVVRFGRIQEEGQHRFAEASTGREGR